MKAYLIQIDAWAGSTATPVRLASHDDDRLCHLDGQTWWPAIATLPTLRYDFFDGAFNASAITSPTGSFTAAIGAIPNLPALALHDARVRVWRGELGDAWAAFALIFDGRVKEQPSISDGIASFSIGTDDSWLDQPLLSTYAGTGGAEGSTDLQGQVKPLALGAPRFAPAVLVDAVDNIYQLSAYGAINAVPLAFDRLSRFGAVEANYASFATLKAATVTRGRWATSLAGGYVKLGAPADGLLTFHVEGDTVGGWARLPGALIARIAAIAGGTAKVASADITALNSARPWNLSLMVTAQTTARELIQRIAASVNAVAYVDWLGMLRVAAVGIGTPTITMAADGSALPPVANVEQVAIGTPYWKVAQGAVVTWQVHALGDIAFTAPLNPRGPYDHAETYREGDMVTLANGSQWLFVGANPATASSPSDSNPNWFRLSENITAANITYEDGTPVEDLKPAEPNATHGATPEQLEQIAAPSITLSRPTVTLWAYENGLVTDFANASGLLKVMSGGNDVTASATLSATATGCTGTINTAANTPVSGQPKGYYRVTAMPGDTAKLTLTAVYGGKTVTAEFQLTKIKAGYEIVASTLPTTNLFEGRLVYRESDGKLYRYKSGAWTAAISGADIDDASLNTAKFASGIEPVTIVSGGSLPTTKSTNTTFYSGKLYRWSGSAYVATVQADDVTGKITSTQIDDNSIQTPHLAANSVVASKMVLSPENVCLDPFFEDLTGYWNGYPSQHSRWTIQDASGWASQALSLPATISLYGEQADRANLATGLIKCDYQGETMWLRGSGRNTTGVGGTSLRLAIWVYDINGVGLPAPSGWFVDFGPDVGGTGAVKSTKFTFPTNCAYYRIAVYNVDPHTSSGNLSIGGIRLTKAADADLIVEGAVLARHLAADSVEAGKIAAGAVNTRELAAGSVRANQMAIVPNNLCLDPFFEDFTPVSVGAGDSYWYNQTTADTWQYENATGGGGVVDLMDAPRAARLGATTGGSSGRKDLWSQQRIIDLKGTSLRFRCKGRNSGPSGSTLSVAVAFYNVAGGFINNAVLSFASGENTAKSRMVTVPAGAVSYRFYMFNSAAFASGWMSVSDVRLEPAADASLIVDGNILARHLASESVETDKLAAGAVVAAKISVTSLAAISANLGNVAVSGNLLVDGTVNGVKIGNGAVDTGKIAAEAVTKSYYTTLATTTPSLTVNAETSILSLSVAGVTAGEVLRLSGILRLLCPDDLEGELIVRYTVNGGVINEVTNDGYKFDSDGGAATRMAVPISRSFVAPSAGTYLFYLIYYNRKSGTNAAAGTNIDVMRQRR